MATDITQHLNRFTIDLTGLPKPVIEQVTKLVDEARQQLAIQDPPTERAPLIGRFAQLGLSIPKEEIDEAQREAWKGFPRDFPETPKS
jgi:hypothetical protein